MTKFNLSGPTCERCGEFLDTEDADCDSCSPEDLQRYHFEHLTDDSVQTVWAVDPRRAWDELMKVVDEPLPWRCTETGYMSLDEHQLGHDVVEVWENNEG